MIHLRESLQGSITPKNGRDATLSGTESTLVDNRASIATLLTELDAATPAGFAIALHIRSHAPTFLFQTFPVGWVDTYHAQGLVMKDPAMHWAFANTGHIRWRELAEDDPHAVLANAKRHGLSYGFTASIHSDRSRSLGGFARGDRDFLDVEIEELSDGFQRLHMLTQDLEVLSEWDRKALQKMSIRMTRGLQ